MNSAAVAVAPLIRERVTRAEPGARCEEEQWCADAVGDVQSAKRLHHRLHAMMVSGHGEHAKETGSSALLFTTLDADFKLQALINLPVLEVAELFVNVIDFGFEPIYSSFD